MRPAGQPGLQIGAADPIAYTRFGMAVNRARLLVAALILGAAVFLVLRRHRADSMAAVLALQNAPDGATPCETAYNAFKASKDVSDTQGVKAVVLSLAPRDEFLARCAGLPPDTQACLTPRYMWKHRADCQRADPGAKLSGMVELLRRTEPSHEDEAGPSSAP